MNRWLMDAPRWVLAVVVAVPVAAVVVLMTRVREDASWTAAIIQGVVTGIVVGAVMGRFLHRQNRRARAAIGDVPDVVRRRAGRAALWGPKPEDPDVRRTALRFAEHGVAQASRRPLLPWIAGVVLIVASTWLALGRSPWWWAAAAFWVAMLVVSFVLPPRLRRRIELLRG